MQQFDLQAKEWDNNPMKVERAKIFATEIINFLNPNPQHTALEFGCGTGLLSYQLKDVFKKITLADTSKGMIDVLNEKIKTQNIPNFEPHLIDILHETLPSNNFDVIYSLMTVHHILDLKSISNKFFNLLKEGGHLCIADLVEEDGSFHKNIEGFDGHNGFNKEQLTSLLENAGFKVIHYKICYTINKEIDNQIKKFPLFLMVAKKVNK